MKKKETSYYFKLKTPNSKPKKKKHSKLQIKSGDPIYNWGHFKTGSATHQEARFNFTT
jgi:hypothetical protein